jgi:proteasome lid subunit RPN8/RPN11
MAGGLILPLALRRQIRRHAASSPVLEVCGLIGGREGRAELAQAITNRLASASAYEMDPGEQLAAFRSFEARQLELIAIYHSHPRGPAHPSATDVAQFMYPGVWTLILSPRGPGWQVRAFLIDSGRILPVKLLA